MSNKRFDDLSIFRREVEDFCIQIQAFIHLYPVA